MRDAHPRIAVCCSINLQRQELQLPLVSRVPPFRRVECSSGCGGRAATFAEVWEVCALWACLWVCFRNCAVPQINERWFPLSYSCCSLWWPSCEKVPAGKHDVFILLVNVMGRARQWKIAQNLLGTCGGACVLHDYRNCYNNKVGYQCGCFKFIQVEVFVCVRLWGKVR